MEAPMNTTTSTTDLYGYAVLDSAGNKIGDVDGVWVDDATDELEFIAAKTGWIFGKNHIMPAVNLQIDSSNGTIQTPYGSDQIKDAPSFSSDAELSPSDEDTIY